MRGQILFPLILISAALLAGARAEEQFPVLAAGREVYTNVTITKVTATDIYFIYAGGMANEKIKNLSPVLQQHFSFDPQKAHAAELQLAENQARYHEQVIHAPVVQPPDLTREPAPRPAAAATVLWRSDLPGALQQAQSENKWVLLDFTGSDWCPWCIKFDQEVLSTGKFAAYAGQKLELVKVDFPRHTPLPAEQSRANEALAARFSVESYPTYVLLNSAGKELGRQSGYRSGGPDAFIAELENFGQ